MDKPRPCFDENCMLDCNCPLHNHRPHLCTANCFKQPNKGIKHDDGKPQLSFVARSLLVAIATIMESGAEKYGRDNWKLGMDWHRPYDALLRHLTAWWEGESLDDDSGMSHLNHAVCELMFLIEYEQKGIGHDDRSKV